MECGKNDRGWGCVSLPNIRKIFKNRLDNTAIMTDKFSEIFVKFYKIKHFGIIFGKLRQNFRGIQMWITLRKILKKS